VRVFIWLLGRGDGKRFIDLIGVNSIIVLYNIMAFVEAESVVSYMIAKPFSRGPFSKNKRDK